MTVHAFSSTAEALRDPNTNFIPGTRDSELVLASTSGSLRRLLEASGLKVIVAPTDHEEANALREVFLMAPTPDSADVAELQVRTNVQGAAARFPSAALVIGAHQVVSLDGKLWEAPRTLESARELLLQLQGSTHQLHSAIALAEEGRITWRSLDTAHITIRPLSA